MRSVRDATRPDDSDLNLLRQCVWLLSQGCCGRGYGGPAQCRAPMQIHRFRAGFLRYMLNLWVLPMPVRLLLERHGEREEGLLSVGRADDLQAERQPVRAEAHRNRDRGPSRQVARPAVAAPRLLSFPQAAGY